MSWMESLPVYIRCTEENILRVAFGTDCNGLPHILTDRRRESTIFNLQKYALPHIPSSLVEFIFSSEKVEPLLGLV